MRLLITAALVGLLVTSIASAQPWPRDQNIAAGEYFLNSDPGEGNGYSITAQYGYAIVDVTLPLPSIPEGTVIYIRFRSSNGKWSAPRGIRYQFPLPNSGATLVDGEYFINEDPGIGQGIPLTIGPNGSIILPNITLNPRNTIYLRVLDSFGRWSAATGRRFMYKGIRAAECYLKYSNGSISPTIPMTLQPHDTSSAFYTAVATLTPSSPQDTVFVRFQTGDYMWGSWQKAPVTGAPTEPVEIAPPTDYVLYANWPNPFNPTTQIVYALPKTGEVALRVFNILGEEVATLVDEIQSAGIHSVSFDGSSLPSGIYLYRLQNAEFVQTKKMVLLK